LRTKFRLRNRKETETETNSLESEPESRIFSKAADLILLRVFRLLRGSCSMMKLRASQSAENLLIFVSFLQFFQNAHADVCGKAMRDSWKGPCQKDVPHGEGVYIYESGVGAIV
jgi:hypothetical protein